MSKSKAHAQMGILAIIYGPSKAGKTVASGALGAPGLFIAQPGALLPLTQYLGIESLNEHRARNVDEATAILKREGPAQPVVVVDDFSLLVEQTVNQLDNKYGYGEMWRHLRKQVLGIRDAARELTESGTSVIFNCHEQPKRTSSGKYIRGGPALPGQLPEQFSAFADIVARAVYDDTAAPWKYVLRTCPDPEYVSGDRLAVFPDPSPMNIREAFREAGFIIARPKGLEWMDDVAEKVCEAVQTNGIEAWRDTLRKASVKLRETYSIPHIRWALQDALHRAIIRNARENALDDLFAQDDDNNW